MAAHTKREKHTLHYPAHYDAPEDCLNFVEMRGFTDDWERMGLTDDDLRALQIGIMTRPKDWPVIKGTGGLRKFRFSPFKKSGKRKWIRICYVYFPAGATILLVIAYAKNEKDDLSDADKKAIKALIARENKIFSQKPVR